MVHVLALDVGTSSVRARVYDERGRSVEGVESQRKYPPAPRVGELDPGVLTTAARAALDQARAGGPPEITAAGASCFWHSLVGVDRRGRPLTPAFTWRDTRSSPQVETLREQLDPEEVHGRTGCPLHPSYWPAKLLWLQETEPDLFRAVDRFVSFSDVLFAELAGEVRTSLSMASGTGLLDLAAGGWDEWLLRVLGLDPERLPPISDEPIGADLAWYPALGDGACSNVGAGCVTSGRAALMVGTSGAFRTVFEHDGPPPRRPGLFLYRLDGRRWVAGGSSSDGGNVYDWLERTLKLPDSPSLAGAEPDGHGLTFLTLLGGERSPGWRTDARGAVHGLTFATTPLDLLQAALEGVAFRFAEIVELMPEVEEVVVTGAGLLNDPDWTQIVADVLGRPLVVSGVDEASARGAAVITLERLGERADPAPLGHVFEPRSEAVEAYRVARERQRRLLREAT